MNESRRPRRADDAVRPGAFACRADSVGRRLLLGLLTAMVARRARTSLEGFSAVFLLVAVVAPFLRRMASRRREERRAIEQLNDSVFAPYLPKGIKGEIELDAEAIDVAGTMHRLDAIELAQAEHGRRLIAEIVWEPGNRYDESALRVSLRAGADRVQCGYIPRRLAPRFQPAVRRNAERGRITIAPARIWSSRSGRFSGVSIGRAERMV